jgi:hypothetical protein
MDMIHVSKLRNGKYMIAEAIRPWREITPAPPSIELTEDDLRTSLRSYGITEKAIAATIEKVKANGTESLTLEHPLAQDSGTIRRPS